LHGAFGSDYVRRAASINTEFRFSITRDVLKVGVQSEVALYTAVDRSSDAGPLLLATSLGPGLHILLEGMFQLDVYATFGLRPDWEGIIAARQGREPQPGYQIFTFGASANLGKAF